MDWTQNLYKARLLRIVDGDTVYLDVDLGLRVHRTLSIRLADINAPEVRGPERAAGLDSKAELGILLAQEGELLVSFQKAKSFDRWVGTIYLETPYGERVNVNHEMVRQGFAEEV